jgi:predicted N-acetyltransferase YhbS
MTASPLAGDPPALRVGLEPGYDGGRFGAWPLDFPGAFHAAASRDLALSQVPSAAGWFRDWLERKGEPIPLAIGPVEVVEVVPATTVDANERMALFAADRAPVPVDEFEVTLRRLGHARLDLLDLVGRIEAFEAGGGRVPDAGERGWLEVLRHVAGTEVWLGSRLDPDARYAGPGRDDPVQDHLVATRHWVERTLRTQHDHDPAVARTDGKGEDWTLRKVLRRILYHSVDHLRELDGRLARAERRADRLELRTDRLRDISPLVRLLRSVGWDRRTVDPGRLDRAIAASHRMVGAWDGDELVGFARDLGDGEFNGLVSMVVVDPRWQRQGIAARLVRALVDGMPHVRFSLGAAGGLDDFYGRMGFEPDDRAMVRRRRA